MIVEFYFVLEVATLLASLALACVLFARDPSQRINRLMAIVPVWLALWSLGEIAWNLQGESQQAEALIRLTAGTWMLLGPACLHLYAELVGARHRAARRLVPLSYAMSLGAFALHLTTGLGLAEVYPVPWGYGFALEASFLLLYATAALPIGFVLVASRTILPGDETERERRMWRSLYAAMLGAWVFVTSTDIVLPAIGVRCPPLGSIGILMITFAIAWQFRRHGYSLMAPSAFAREILEALGEGVVMLHANGRIRMANATFERLVGASKAEIHGALFARFAPGLDVDPRNMTEDIECDLETVDGKTVRVMISPTPLRNPSGNTRGAALLIRDLREVAALRGSLVASDRLAMVGGLSASISDEIREPIEKVQSHLEGMRGHLTTLREFVAEAPADEKLDELVADREELLDECLEGVARIEAIVRDVRGFSAGQSGPREKVDPNNLIEGALRIAITRSGRDVTIEKDFEQLEAIECCSGEIVQVLVNLLVNAIHATDGQGRIQLSSFSNEGEVWICVEDDGTGIPPDIMSRIFDPFFTTKRVGEGTGLGLAISVHLVHNHGGDLRVESEPGRGSRFTLALPTDPEAPVVRGAVAGILSG
ncbi:MAG: ATP-binding protein [Myxococcota bacterium]|jgi:two-component system NtrC family sensor kinase|nr:ATP-binding protein [Myxococcota bacterium]